MQRFRYEAVNFRGERRSGELESASKEAALEYLYRKNLVPLHISKEKDFFSIQIKRLLSKNARKMSERDFSILIQEVALMLKSGLNLEQALEVCVSLTPGRDTKQFLRTVLSHIREGYSFAESLDCYSNFRPSKAFIGMVYAGEMGGGSMMGKTLEHLADSLSKRLITKEAIRSALIYPAILMMMAGLSVIVMLVFVLPQFEPIFQNAGTTPSFSAQIVMSMGHLLRDHWEQGVASLIISFFAIRRILKLNRIKLWVDEKVLRFPIIGQLVSKSETAQLCRTLGELQSNGIPLVKALGIATESLKNALYIQTMTSIARQVREGKSFSSLMLKEKIFPVAAGQMMRIGEETGHLDLMALKVSDIFERDVQKSMQRIINLLAPMLTIIVGGFIAAIIAIVMSAILSANDLVT